MATQEKREIHRILLPTYVGSALGLLAYVLLGAIPGMLYGGYMGLAMAGAILGAPVEATILSKAFVAGGVLLGLVASLSLFLVLGALMGTAIGYVLGTVRDAISVRARMQTAPIATNGNPAPGAIVAELKESVAPAKEAGKRSSAC